MRPRDIRRDNLRLLVKQFGTIAALARAAGTNEKYLSQILKGVVQSKSPRAVGDRLVERLETAAKKEHGWMDQDHTGGITASAPTLNDVTAKYIPDDVRAQLDEIGGIWPKLFEEQRAELIEIIRERAERAKRIYDEMRRRGLDKFAPDGYVAKFIDPRPAQRDLPIEPPATAEKGTGRRGSK